MKTLLKSAARRRPVARRRAARLAQAQAAAGPLVPGLAVADLDGVVANSNAYKLAAAAAPGDLQGAARPGRSAPHGDHRAAQAAGRQVQRRSPGAPTRTRPRCSSRPRRSSRSSRRASRNCSRSCSRSRCRKPMSRADRRQARRRGQGRDDQEARSRCCSRRSAVAAFNNNAYNLNQAIIAELNTLLPSAQLVPPAGWQPREVREQQRRSRPAQQGSGCSGRRSRRPVRRRSGS